MTSSVRVVAVTATVFIGALAATAHGQVVPPDRSASATAEKQPGSKGALRSSVRPTYRSAFEDFRGYREEPVGPWRAANDNVRSIGGWRAYARESAATPAAGSGASSAPAGAHPGHVKP